ncbi:MAG: M56 family metallopeptidase [Chryseolinea sp.]
MMDFVTKLLTSPTTEALGWTLLHSLWFGFLCFSITWIALRLLPSRMSDLRYIVATVGLLFILISSVVVFVLMLPSEISQPVVTANNNLVRLATYQIPQDSYTTPGILAVATEFIRVNMSFIVFVWVIGALITSLKVFGGYLYVSKIRSQSNVIDGGWEPKIQQLAERLGVYRYVVLAESALIRAPVVMGYIKPMILVPVGMMSGLSTEQLETIFIHELTHIRRGDYIVNIFQSFLEAIYFFNPFVWALSDMMRREREHCCDDAVLEVHGNPLAYVKALASLEEARLTRAGVALSLAEDKNHLLKRIKRIMEKSVQRYSGREKLVPAVLLVLGLMCASWLTIQTETRAQQRPSATPLAVENTQGADPISFVSDTTIKEQSTHKKTIIRIHENGDSETFEVYDDGDDDDSHMNFNMPGFSMHMDPIPPIPPIDMDFHFEMPEMPEIEAMDFAMPAIETMQRMDIRVNIPPIPMMGPMPSLRTVPFSFRMDTIQPDHFNRQQDWDEFGKEFEKSFREKFEGFYEQHEEEMEEMMERLEEKFNRDHHEADDNHDNNDDNDNDNDQQWGTSAREHQSHDVRRQNNGIGNQAAAVADKNFEIREQNQRFRDANRDANSVARQLDQVATIQAEKSRHAQGQALVVTEMKARKFADMKALEANAENMKISGDKWAQDWTKRMEESQRVAKKELVKDGYLKDSDQINNIEISNDDVTVNGMKIKGSDQQKYRKLLGQDLRHPGRME